MSRCRYAAPDAFQAGSCQVNGILLCNLCLKCLGSPTPAVLGWCSGTISGRPKAGTHSEPGMGMVPRFGFYSRPPGRLPGLLDAKTGKERLDKAISDFSAQINSPPLRDVIVIYLACWAPRRMI